MYLWERSLGAGMFGQVRSWLLRGLSRRWSFERSVCSSRALLRPGEEEGGGARPASGRQSQAAAASLRAASLASRTERLASNGMILCLVGRQLAPRQTRRPRRCLGRDAARAGGRRVFPSSPSSVCPAASRCRVQVHLVSHRHQARRAAIKLIKISTAPGATSHAAKVAALNSELDAGLRAAQASNHVVKVRTRDRRTAHRAAATQTHAHTV